MSELRSAVEALRAETLAELPDARIEEDFAEMRRVVDQLELEALRRLGEIERRRLFERDGHLSAASWLATAFKMSWSLAREQVRTARALEEMPATRDAVASGDVSLCAVRSLVAAREADLAAFADAEPMLVEAARIHSVGDLGRVVAYWRDAVESERGVDREEAMRARRRLHASTTLHGMVRVDGMLDPETGETVLTAMRAVVDAETRGRGKDEADDRSPAQRRADALGEVCRQHHRAIHAGRARLDMEGGLPVFRRSDGSRLERRSLLAA